MRQLLRQLGVAIGLTCVASVAVSGQKAPPCPLTDAQTRKSIEAFAKIHAFVTGEPRCVNCHGGVNPYLAGTGLDPEDASAPPSLSEHFVALDHKKSDGLVDQQCRECHNNMAKRADGSASLWMTAAPFHTFVDKDAVSLCRQFKRATGSAEKFLAHVKNDEGGNNFAGTAFNGNRGLDPKQFADVAAEPPSISHDAFMKLAQDWVAAMGGRFQGDEGCGCEPRHSRWSGQIHYMVQGGGEGHGDLQTWSGYNVTQVTVTVTDGVGSYHGHHEEQNQLVSLHPVALGGGRGTLQFEYSTSSEGSADGTMPTTVDVDINEDRGVYSVALGRFDGKLPPKLPAAVGKAIFVQCYRADCKTTEQDLGMPGLRAMSPMSGTLKERDRIDESQTVTYPPSSFRDGPRTETMSVHLWRSSSN
jgi:hypothetical protein